MLAQVHRREAMETTRPSIQHSLRLAVAVAVDTVGVAELVAVQENQAVVAVAQARLITTLFAQHLLKELSLAQQVMEIAAV